jgi:DNA-binding NtrC family response regulator
MNKPESRILFVDDEPKILETLSLVFRGWHFKTAVGAKAALSLFESEEFGVVVSDQRMPEMTGVEFLKKVREQSPSTVRILLTGYSDMDSVLDSINSGEVYRFINKPWDNEKLKETVQTACKMFELNAELKDDVSSKGTTVPLEKIKILFIDKFTAHLQGYKSLYDAKHQVYTAQALDAALDILNENAIGVLACDSTLVTEAGAEFLAAVCDRFPDTVTIFMSDSKDSNEAIRLINDGQIFRYLTKPFPRADFTAAVDAALARHKEFLANPHRNIKRQESQILQSKPSATTMPLNDFLTDIRSKMKTKRAY